MSAVRHNRRGSRAAHISPYSRPTKQSSWNFSTLFSFLNPLRFRTWDEQSESGESSEGLPISSYSTEVGDASQVLEGYNSGNQHDTAMQTDLDRSQRSLDPPRDRRFQLPMDRTSPPKQSIAAALCLDDTDDSSPSKNIEIVTKFLEERGGKPMSSVELEGVISLLRKSAQPEKHEPFRFSFSTSPTPGRSDSPDTVGENTTSNNGEMQAPRKMLTKNPNGVYRWRGGGSARPARSRNRYASPAFGSSRSTGDRLVLKDSMATGEGSRADNKRRRIEEEVTGPSSTLSAKTPASANGSSTVLTASSDASNVANAGSVSSSARQTNGVGAQPKVNGLSNGSAPFRLRTPGLQKPTTPSVPSPLRQAWSGSASDVSTSPVPTPPTPPKPTKAANLMAELIKEVTPPKKPDVSNPYQTASPVKITPVSRPRHKRTRPTPRQTQPEATKPETEPSAKGDETKVDKVTPQAIIEATLPKGSKRARPPTHFEKAPLPELVAPAERALEETRTKTSYVAEEVDEDEDARAKVAKKPKPYLNGRGGAPSERRLACDGIVVEEIQDVEMGDTGEKPVPKAAASPIVPTSAPASTKSTFSHKPRSLPKEPSKLRFSYQPENTTVLSAAATEAVVTVPEPQPEGSPAERMVVANAPEPKAVALALPISSLPNFTFAFTLLPTSTLSPGEKLAQGQVISKPESSLPKFTFSSKPQSAPPANTVAPIPVKAFDWSAAGVKPPPASATDGSWTCSTCGLANPASATEKCTICEAPASTIAPTPVKTFDWSAAGVKPPAPSTTGGSWSCSTCMLMNPASATEKCIICDAPR